MNGFWVLVASLVVVAVAVFFALREFWTWYWKQSEQAELLKRIAESLERLEARQDAAAAGKAWRSPTGWSPTPAAASKGWKDGVLDRMAGVS